MFTSKFYGFFFVFFFFFFFFFLSLAYNSAATDQKLFMFGMEVPGRVFFHAPSMESGLCPRPGLKVKI